MEDVKTKIDEAQKKMEGDTPFLPFLGPISDQDGKVQIAAGDTPTIDYLESMDWNKRAPGPNLPAVVIERTREKYAEALRRLTE